MKELEITVEVRNNRLKERRMRLGLSQADLADKVGINQSTYSGLESTRICPLQLSPGRDGGFGQDPMWSGGWKRSALRLAKFYGVEPAELFPDSVLSLKRRRAVRFVDSNELGHFLAPVDRLALESPDAATERKEKAEIVAHGMEGLSERHKQVLVRRYSLDGEGEAALEDIAREIGVTVERVRQIERKAIEKIRFYAHHGRRLGRMERRQ